MDTNQTVTKATIVNVYVYLIIALVAGCSAEATTQRGAYGGTSTSNSNAAGASGSAVGQGGASGDDTTGIPIPIAGGTDLLGYRPEQQGMEETDACASAIHEAREVEVEVETEVEVEVVKGEPVTLYIMLDQSRSMNETPFQELNSKWQVAVDAITAFVNDPASENLDIALQYFPLQNGQCAGGGYDTPEVPVGRLLAHASNITTSLAAHFPGMVTVGVGGGNTPIEGALNGATSFCAQFKQDSLANPDGEECVAVLVTDGLPTICSQDWAALTGIAANAYANAGVMTFAIGMNGADFLLLDQIAQAGNGDCTPDTADPTWSCNVSTGGTTFIDALNLIRDTVTEMQTVTEVHTETRTEALECEWAIPVPPEGEEFDRNKVNVEFSPTGQDTDQQQFGRVTSQADCFDKLGWYYDDPNDPTRIIACKNSCSLIQSSEAGRVNILLGCKTLLF